MVNSVGQTLCTAFDSLTVYTACMTIMDVYESNGLPLPLLASKEWQVTTEETSVA